MADKEGRIRRAVKKSLIMSTNSRQCICETLRLIYDELHDYPDNVLKEKVVELLVDAMVMAKKMQNRLLYYKKTYNDGTGDDGANLKRLWGAGERRKLRKERTI